MKSQTNISKRYEKDLLKALNIYVSFNSIKSNLIIENLDFKEAFIKGCIGLLGNSVKFQNFIRDLYYNKLKKKYYFASIEEIDLANIFINLLDSKKKVIFIF